MIFLHCILICTSFCLLCVCIRTCVNVYKVLHAEVGQAAADTVSSPHCWLRRTHKNGHFLLSVVMTTWFEISVNNMLLSVGTSSSGEMRICPSSRQQLLMSHKGTSWGGTHCSLESSQGPAGVGTTSFKPAIQVNVAQTNTFWYRSIM